MIKYYTRACNFYYGSQAKFLIKKKRAFPLCGKKNIAFDTLEIFSKKQKKIKSKFVNIKEIKYLKKLELSKIQKDLKKITSKRKNFLKNISFANPIIMGILNLTPDSFSDGGKFNNNKLKRYVLICYCKRNSSFFFFEKNRLFIAYNRGIKT